MYSSRLGEVGTPGYIDPEYVQSRVYRRHSDVYSMGIVILQVLTGRATMFTHEAQRIALVDFCYNAMQQGNVSTISDADAAWPAQVVEPLSQMAFACTETGRGFNQRRPDVELCISKIQDIIALMDDPPHMPEEWVDRECIVCLDAPRGECRFRPCRHAVVCTDCATIILDRNDPCPLCRQPTESVQDGIFAMTFQPGIE